MAQQLPVEVLSVEEAERLIARPDPDDVFGLRDAAILATLYYAGATAGEAVALDLRDVDLHAEELRLRNEGGRRRRVPIEPHLVGVLTRYIEKARRLLIAQAGGQDPDDVAPFFISNRGHRITVQDVRQILGTHSKAAGLKAAVNYNTLRLSRAWHLREAGSSPEAIQQFLGTSSRSGRRVV